MLKLARLNDSAVHTLSVAAGRNIDFLVPRDRNKWSLSALCRWSH